jgi:DNA invertase Pin-like site-specific DNA recombinase
MHPQCSTATTPVPPSLVAALPLAGKLRPAATIRAGLAYARVSKTVQTSIPDQFDSIAKLGRLIDVPVLTELHDTGSGMLSDRDGYQAVLDHAATEQYSHLLLFRADRLARDSAELQNTVKKLWQLGMEVWDTSTGKITPDNLPFLAMWAEMEIRILSERTKMGLEGKAKMGKKLGSIPLGYRPGKRKGHPEIDPELGPVVAELFERVARGESLAAVLRWLEARTGRRLARPSLWGLLRNPFYAGVVVNFRMCHSILQGRYARPQNEWRSAQHDQPLITPELFTQVQAQLAKHQNVGQHRAKRSSYALQGLLWCRRCSRRMYGQSKSGKGSHYRCPVCNMQRSLRKVEGAVQQGLALLELCADDALQVAQRHQEAQRAHLQEELRAASKEVSRLTLRRHLLYERLDRGVIDEEAYKMGVRVLDAERDEWRAREAMLKAQLGALPANEALAARVAVERTDWKEWTRKIGARPIAQQQQIYRECCARIALDCAEKTMTVEYTPHIALVLGRERYTVAF